MTARVLETVPNFSEGRDRRVIAEIVDAMRAAGADVVDVSADADHHRAVVTAVGSPAAVEAAAVAGARVAKERIDLRGHEGVHPRIGAVDVVPFVPLYGLSMDDASASARRVGERLAREVGLPVFFYGAASEPQGRRLAELRRGGFEGLANGWPAGRRPDVEPRGWPHPGAHPSAGAVCVGARKLLLAWNVEVRGIDREQAVTIARRLREANSGLQGVRALALALSRRDALEISMNLEDLDATAPMTVFRKLEKLVAEAGGEVAATEVVGLVPDALVTGAAEDRLRLLRGTGDRMLTRRLLEHVTRSQRAPTTVELVSHSE